MDPLTITATCVGLLASITKLSLQISDFVINVRDARRDMDAIRRELASLELCVCSLREDFSGAKVQYPDSLEQNLIGVLGNADSVTVEMRQLLDDMSSANLRRRVQWSITGRDEMNKLRSRLEAHKSALDIALDMVSIILVAAVKKDTEVLVDQATAIKHDTSRICKDTNQIPDLVAEISRLRIQITEIHNQNGGKQRNNFILERFLDESETYAETAYAESVVDPEEWPSVRVDRPEAHTPPADTVHEPGCQLPPKGIDVGSRPFNGQNKELLPQIKQFTPVEIQSNAKPLTEHPSRQAHFRFNEQAIAINRQARSRLTDKQRNSMDQQFREACLFIEMNESVSKKQFGRVRALLDEGADVNASGTGYSQHLRIQALVMMAIWSPQCAKLLRLLLERGAKIPPPEQLNQYVCFKFASGVSSNYGPLELVQLLKDAGADFSNRDGVYYSTLKIAIAYNNLKLVSFFLQIGMCTDILSEKIEWHGTKKEALEMVCLLETHGLHYAVRQPYNGLYYLARKAGLKQI